jgi:hypothetical protein
MNQIFSDKGVTSQIVYHKNIPYQMDYYTCEHINSLL